MKKRRTFLFLLSVLLFTSANLFFHYFEFWIPLLVYIAMVNGLIVGLIAGYFSNKIFETADLKVKCLYAGFIVGLFLALLWVNNQISIEFYINRENINPMPPYVDYFRFYLIGLSLGIVKSFYYAIVPSVVILTAVGFLLEKIRSFRKST